MHKSIKVRIIKETTNRVTLRFMSTNSQMSVLRDEFEKRVNEGTYNVLNPTPTPEQVAEAEAAKKAEEEAAKAKAEAEVAASAEATEEAEAAAPEVEE
jgi:hypothetical protein